MSTKKLNIRPATNKGSLYEVYYEGGGQVPGCLSGLYNRRSVAWAAVEKYVPPAPKKVTKDESEIS